MSASQPTSAARVIVLAGPSGSGKSRLAERLGLRTLRLDDFYRDGDDPGLPRITAGPNAGIVDWDHVDSWHVDDAMAAIATLCREGRVEVPRYDLAASARVDTGVLDLAGGRLFVAEGIFAPEVVPACEEAELLAAAFCLTQHPMVTFWRRLTRDLREHRKPPMVLLRRGLALARDQRRVIAHAVALGCRPVTNERAYAQVRALAEDCQESSVPDLTGLRQPDARSCGAAVLVAARMLDDPEYADGVDPRTFGAHVVAVHRDLAAPGQTGRRQLPWPRALGTAPWALGRAMPGGRRLRPLLTRRSRERRWRQVRETVAAGTPVPLYVGPSWAPRHVVLVIGAVGDRLRIYEPTKGAVVAETREAFVAGRLEQSGWPRPWLALL